MSSDTEIKAEEGEENVSDRVGKLILPSDDDIWNSQIKEIIDLRVEDAKCLLQILGSLKIGLSYSFI